jgi:hypothetical protein
VFKHYSAKHLKLKTIRIHFLLKLCAVLLFANSAVAQNTGRITGTVLDKNTQQPMELCNVVIEGTTLGATTDTLGKFRIVAIPLKSHNIIITKVGYKKYTIYNVVVNAGNENTFTIELEQETEQLKDVVVTVNKRTAKAATLETPLSVQRLTAEEIKSNPGGNFDISKVIQVLPGVGGGPQGGSFRNDIIIRGGGPSENVFYLDGIEVPVINHFQTQGSSGGPQGILNVSFIEDVKLSTSAFDAKYDNALSSVFQFKQKNGNPNKLQGNFRLSASEVALTLDGPLSKSKKTTFLASARRSYLGLLFKALDLPIRPNYWDFQTKITHQINSKTTLTFLAIGAIDDFKFGVPKEATAEKIFLINSNVLVNQWNYTVGASLKKIVNKGYWNLSLAHTNFNNDLKKYEDNQNPTIANKTLDINSSEAETKLRFDVNKNYNGLKLAYGATAQLANYNNSTFSVIQKQLVDANGNITRPAINATFKSPLGAFIRYGAFVQLGKRFFDNRLGISAGLRTDMNSFTTTGGNPLKTLSPRISASYVLADKWTWNTTLGSYYKLPPYTLLGFANNSNTLVNKQANYQHTNHYTTGIEYLPNDGLRITVEGFYKQYSNMPISLATGISLANLGTDFTLLGNEAVSTNGKGRAYGTEFFIQKKLTKKFFGILSYTFYRSLFTGSNGKYIASSWDNRQLLSIAWGYKFPKNWELGLKFRFQGGAPYTPYNEVASQQNYLAQGKGTFDYSRLNSLRLNSFNSSDVRIDKKWNFKKTTIDLFMDITNWYASKNAGVPDYTFKRNATNTGFETTNGQPIRQDGSNAVPIRLLNADALVTPSIGLIVEF